MWQVLLCVSMYLRVLGHEIKCVSSYRFVSLSKEKTMKTCPRQFSTPAPPTPSPLFRPPGCYPDLQHQHAFLVSIFCQRDFCKTEPEPEPTTFKPCPGSPSLQRERLSAPASLGVTSCLRLYQVFHHARAHVTLHLPCQCPWSGPLACSIQDWTANTSGFVRLHSVFLLFFYNLLKT